MTFERRTVRTEVALEGKGLHSGAAVNVRLIPGDSGIRFHFGGKSWDASPENIRETNRSTALGEVGTVEHAMAALAGCGITDLDIEVSSPELPALDGSALPYVGALRQAGFVSLGQAELPTLFTRVYLHEGDAKLAISAGEGHWRYEFSSAEHWPHFQAFESKLVHEEFEREIAPARTFGFEHELPMIEKAGLAKGLDRTSALVIGSDGYANEARFEDEPARHKLLDAIGDLYLAGMPIKFLNVVAERTGHRMNVLAAKRLRDALHLR
jgi:UDP-3-O-acyl-N-acetylglucosamine deacetylase